LSCHGRIMRASRTPFVCMAALLCWMAAVSFAQEIRNAEATSASPVDPVLVGAGDIASCDDLAGAEATAKLIDKIPGTVMAVGDLAYPDGSEEEFATCYGPTWGRFRQRTRPAVGNHEYHKGGPSAYSHYFGSVAGDPAKAYYSYDLGTWHIVVLNSECEEVGGCEITSPQGLWLKQDLAQHSATCTLAYFHKPLFFTTRVRRLSSTATIIITNASRLRISKDVYRNLAASANLLWEPAARIRIARSAWFSLIVRSETTKPTES
jgi:hypothetical protein